MSEKGESRSGDSVVVIAGMSRGGTNLLWNVVQSHPAMIDSYYELNEIFGGTTDIGFAAKACIELEALGGVALRRVADLTRSRLKQFALMSFTQDEFNREKRPGLRYDDEEFSSLTMCTKLVSSWETDPLRKLLRRNDALKYLPLLRRAFAKVTVVFLVRNGLAVAEGWGRRGASTDTAAHWYGHYVRCYEKYVQEHSSESMIVRFEDMLADPFNAAAHIYGQLGLDDGPARQLRIAVKPTIRANRDVMNTTRKTKRWIDHENWREHLDVSINEAQIDRMRAQDKERFLRTNREIMERYGYV